MNTIHLEPITMLGYSTLVFCYLNHCHNILVNDLLTPGKVASVNSSWTKVPPIKAGTANSTISQHTGTFKLKLLCPNIIPYLKEQLMTQAQNLVYYLRSYNAISPS